MDEKQSNPPRSEFREYLEALLIAAVFLGFTNTFLVKTFFIPSGSMKETLLIGDHLFVNRFIYGPAATDLERKLLPLREPERGDVVIFRSPRKPVEDLVKRLIGLPGDRIRMVDQQLYLNNQRVDGSAYIQHTDDRPYIPAATRRVRDNFGPVEVEDDRFYFMGDNRDHSLDSRYWGTVPRHFIKGRAFLIYWSFEGETSDGQWYGVGDKLKGIGKTIIGFPTKTRWLRTFHLIR